MPDLDGAASWYIWIIIMSQTTESRCSKKNTHHLEPNSFLLESKLMKRTAEARSLMLPVVTISEQALPERWVDTLSSILKCTMVAGWTHYLDPMETLRFRSPYLLCLQMNFLKISNKSSVSQDEWCMYIFEVEQAKIKIKVLRVLSSSSAVFLGWFLSLQGSDNITCPKVIFSFKVKISGGSSL